MLPARQQPSKAQQCAGKYVSSLGSTTDKGTASGPHQCTKDVSLPYCLQPWVTLSKSGPYRAPSKLLKYLQAIGKDVTLHRDKHELGGSLPTASLMLWPAPTH